MTTRYINGSYPDGYVIAPEINTLNIGTAATIGGVGVSSAQTTPIKVANLGAVTVYQDLPPYHHYTGIRLVGGGTVVNGSSINDTAVILGRHGVDISGGVGTVINLGGTIGSTRYAGAMPQTYWQFPSVALRAGGSVVNASAGGISNGVNISGTAGTVVNNGAIGAGSYFRTPFITTDYISFYPSIVLGAGGRIVNGNANTNASIDGVNISGGIGSVVNGGTITGTRRIVVDIGFLLDLTVSSSISLTAGGTVINESSGNLSNGVAVGGEGTVRNLGHIGAGYKRDFRDKKTRFDSVILDHGTVVNGSMSDTAATIDGGLVGVHIANAPGHVVNFGLIAGDVDSDTPSTGHFSAGIRLGGGGSVVNGSDADSSARISGYDGGVYVAGGAAQITNFGTITETSPEGASKAFAGQAGLGIQAGGSVVNGSDSNSAALISGVIGVDLHGAGAITNFGTISGTTFAVELHDPSARLVEEGSGVLSGAVAGGGGTLILDGKAGVGTLSGLGSIITGFADVVVASNAHWVLNGTNSLTTAMTLTNTGTLTLFDAALADAGSLLNHGAIILDASSLTVARLIGAGSITIDASSTLDVRGAVASGETIDLAGSDGLLRLGTPADVAALIDGFTPTDIIDLTELPVSDISSVTIKSGNTLAVVQTGGTTLNLRLDPLQDFSGLVARYETDGAHGTNITLGVPCFRAGTHISTERGDVRVEDLHEGDRVQLLLGGTAEPVVWIGHRTVDCRRHPQPRQVWPVRISKGAFGLGLPGRDLWLSPDHAVFVDDVLIPVKHLINRRSIVQMSTDEVTYYHVELPQHAVLFAEGLPAESYLDIGDRTDFANGTGPMRLFPDFSSLRSDAMAVWEAQGCAPLTIVGPKVEAMCRFLAQRVVTLHTQPSGQQHRMTQSCHTLDSHLLDWRQRPWVPRIDRLGGGIRHGAVTC